MVQSHLCTYTNTHLRYTDLQNGAHVNRVTAEIFCTSVSVYYHPGVNCGTFANIHII